jgi:Signal peptidase, peptidase S26
MRRRLIALLLILLLLPGCDGGGDRVLVGKFLYDTDVVPPSRYDVVVFKYPAMPMENGTPKNYIKRLLGLPGELIAIFFGRLYVFTPPAKGVPDGIAEKEWRELTDMSYTDQVDLWKGPKPLKDEGKLSRNFLNPTAQKLWDQKQFKILQKPPSVMLALSRPVFDNDHQAKDLKGILPDRWAPVSSSAWVADNETGFATAGESKSEEWLHYRHILRPPSWPAKNSPNRDETIQRIKEDKHWPQLITDFLGYNTYESLRITGGQNWAGDLMLSLRLTVDSPKGQFWMELSRGVDRFQARFDLATGVCSLYRRSEHKKKEIVENGVTKEAPDWQLLQSADTRVKAKGTYALRFANYDERLTVWVDRDLPFDEGKKYDPPAKVGPDSEEDADARHLEDIKNNDLQPASLCSVGAPVKVNSLQLWRDTYYTGFAIHPGPPIETEILVCDHRPSIQNDDWSHPRQWESLRHLDAKTIYIYPRHYLCLGDNSQASSDSREWGLVPDRLMLGRALLVYFPFDRAGTIK